MSTQMFSRDAFPTDSRNTGGAGKPRCSWALVLPNESAGMAHELEPGNHNKTVVLEVSIGVRWGPAVGSVAHPGQGLPLPSIEADFDVRLMGIDGGQSRPQFRLIPRDDDETRKHWLDLPTGVPRRSQCRG